MRADDAPSLVKARYRMRRNETVSPPVPVIYQLSER